MTRKNDIPGRFGKCRFLQPVPRKIEPQIEPVRHRHNFRFDFRLSSSKYGHSTNAISVRYRPLRRDVHVSSVGADITKSHRPLFLGGRPVRFGRSIVVLGFATEMRRGEREFLHGFMEKPPLESQRRPLTFFPVQVHLFQDKSLPPP
jgi:hypothetical protein